MRSTRAILRAARAVVFAVAVLLVAGVPVLRTTGSVTAAPGAPTGETPERILANELHAQPLNKIETALRPVAQHAPAGARATIVVLSTNAPNVAPFASFTHHFTWPAGEHVTVAEVGAKDLLAIAALPGVYGVYQGDPKAVVSGPDDGRPADARPVADPATVRQRAQAAAPWRAPTAAPAHSASAPTGAALAAGIDAGIQPTGWFDALSGHAAAEAWALGYRGEGVTVGVLDFGIDFANPDLQGTWKTLPSSHPYSGWPQAFDPYATYLATLDKNPNLTPEQHSTRSAQSGMVELYQDSDVTPGQGDAPATACFKPYILATGANVYGLGDLDCGYKVPAVSKSGTVRFGHHPDGYLFGLGAKPDKGVAAEAAGVLLVDANVAGHYDTVYVDLNNNRDFTDEKPMTKADPVSWRDISDPPDGIPDLSGGLLYWISDGEAPFPGAWVWGLEKDIPPVGRIIALQMATGDHATLCGSNIVSQGKLGVPSDRILAFRNLPGNHKPESVNLGMAPGAKLVSIGSVYEVGPIIFSAAWRYAIFGHDKTRDDDNIQVTSNSYGFSAADDDGWEADSRLIDYYVRTFSPTTTFLAATGNGGPGYGTITPPKASVGMGVAASTQMGSTGTDSITDTAQITYGDLIPFSDRGPMASGRGGPSIAADGAYATGDEPLNVVTIGGSDGAHAFGSWGGTSRSTPVATGVVALAYQAFMHSQGRWPTWEEARALIMSGARFNGYDPFTVGAGVVDAADTVRIAAGLNGIYSVPSEWTAGGFHGQVHPAFAKLVSPGDVATTTLTLHNPSDHAIDVHLSAQTPRRLGATDGTLTTDRLKESSPAPPAFPVPDYLLPIDKAKIPAGTELMVARGVYPLSEFDVNGDMAVDNQWEMGVLQHTDINHDGKLWVDKNGNGVVNHRELTDSYVKFAWDDQTEQHDALEGAITKPLPYDGVSELAGWFGRGCTDDPQEGDVTGKIALVARGVCTFNEKINNAQKAGAVAVLVFTDYRPTTTMGGSAAGIAVPGVMIDEAPGLKLRDLLVAGKAVTVGMYPQHYTGVGISGSAPVIFKDTDIEQYEYMRLNYDSNARNNWAISVHHPLERWADGLYLEFKHVAPSLAVTNTHMTYRLDYYKYQPWDALSLSASTVTIPAHGQATVTARLAVPAGAAYGALQGAIFADYPRGAGDKPVTPPGGYELDNLRTVIPVNANVGARYDWAHSVTLGGQAGNDMDTPYNNGAMQGTFKWDWRPESGDWRFFFVDAAEPPPDNTWIFRTQWTDGQAHQTDIDTRVLGPAADRFTNPADPANATENAADTDWFGPYTLQLLVRSVYALVPGTGSTWAFNTSSGANDDWLLAPAAAGLHEVMLDNVLFSGSKIDVPFETTVGSIQMPSKVLLFGNACSDLSLTPTLDLPGFALASFGLSVPQQFNAQPIAQDDPNDPSTATFKHDVTLSGPAARFAATLQGQTGDDLDLYIMFDANNDGTFAYPGERVAFSNGPSPDEAASVRPIAAAGHYQVWVHGSTVTGTGHTFSLTLDVITGSALQVKGVPDKLTAGQTTTLQLCADTSALADQNGPANALMILGPSGSPQLLNVSAEWWRNQGDAPTIYLPALSKGATMPGR